MLNYLVFFNLAIYFLSTSYLNPARSPDVNVAYHTPSQLWLPLISQTKVRGLFECLPLSRTLKNTKGTNPLSLPFCAGARPLAMLSFCACAIGGEGKSEWKLRIIKTLPISQAQRQRILLPLARKRLCACVIGTGGLTMWYVALLLCGVITIIVAISTVALIKKGSCLEPLSLAYPYPDALAFEAGEAIWDPTLEWSSFVIPESGYFVDLKADPISTEAKVTCYDLTSTLSLAGPEAQTNSLPLCGSDPLPSYLGYAYHREKGARAGLVKGSIAKGSGPGLEVNYLLFLNNKWKSLPNPRLIIPSLSGLRPGRSNPSLFPLALALPLRERGGLGNKQQVRWQGSRCKPKGQGRLILWIKIIFRILSILLFSLYVFIYGDLSHIISYLKTMTIKDLAKIWLIGNVASLLYFISSFIIYIYYCKQLDKVGSAGKIKISIFWPPFIRGRLEELLVISKAPVEYRGKRVQTFWWLIYSFCFSVSILLYYIYG